MSENYPTYKLDPDFDRKLDQYIDSIIEQGYQNFEKEFSRIDSFLDQVAQEPVNRDAHQLRLTPKLKYLHELISFKIYDRLNRKAFNQTGKTLLVLPDCFSSHRDDCQKTDEKTGDVCQLCDPECQGFQVSELADEYDAIAVFSKRKLTEQLKYYKSKYHNIGVVGIGCVLMLAEGMRSASDADIPSRGVLLNCCGCEHWNDQPFASPFPFEQLKKIMEEKHGT